MKEKKPKVYAVDPVTGLKRINYNWKAKRRYRWDDNVPGGVVIEVPTIPFADEEWEEDS